MNENTVDLIEIIVRARIEAFSQGFSERQGRTSWQI